MIVLLAFSIGSNLLAQAKYDNVWVSGIWGNQPNLLFGGSKIEFTSGAPISTYFDLPFQFDANASICDQHGNLLFYTNGCEISSKTHSIMENGDDLNPGFGQENFCKTDVLGYSKGYRAHQGIVIVPNPGDSSIYNIFHLNFKYDVQYQVELLETTVDMRMNNGLGKVIEKNVLIKQDTCSDNLTAVRHGNGRDWWIVAPKQGSSQYYLYLLGPTGISEEKLVNCGTAYFQHPWGGQASFSPDGAKYARVRPIDGLEIMDFDRCAGAFSFPVHTDFGDSLYASGCAFSSNSRYLYVSAIFLTTSYIYQFDLQATDILASKTPVAQWDGISDPFATNFYQQALAPNEKIYVGTGNGTRYYHIIHAPNLPGMACQVEQRALTLPTYHAIPMPNFPQFRTQKLTGSLCDTISLSSAVKLDKEKGFKLFPNPTKDWLFVEIDSSIPQDKIISIELIDHSGKPILTMPQILGSDTLKLSLANVPKGIYTIKLSFYDGSYNVQKLVVY